MTSKAPNVEVHLPQKAFYHFIQLINEEYAFIDIMFITSSIFAHIYFAMIYFPLMPNSYTKQTSQMHDTNLFYYL